MPLTYTLPRILCCAAAVLLMTLAAQTEPARADDQPQWGQAWTRNMVSSEKNLPESFQPGRRDPQTGEIDPASTKGVAWTARLGRITYGTPIIADGRVYVGTNNDIPRDEKIQGDRGVLAVFDEKTGEFLWQLVVPKLLSIRWADWYHIGITSPPTVEGDRVYLVSNRAEVLCLDVNGMANGNDGPFTDEARLRAAEGEQPVPTGKKDADILWVYDMVKQLGVRPHNAANCSVLVDGDLLYLCTSHGVEHTHKRVINPEAPSMIVVNKKTGRLVARDNFGIGPDISHGQWSSPSMGTVNGRKLIFFGDGNGYLYACKPLRPEKAAGVKEGDKPLLLENAWRFNGHPLAQTQDHVPIDHQHDSTSYEIVGMPVYCKDRVYVIFTQEAYHGMKLGYVACLDATGSGDVTRKALLWKCDATGSSVSTVAINDGLLYVTDYAGHIRCLDAETGKEYWEHRVGGPISGSTLVADGKVYFGTERQTFHVLAAGKEFREISRIRVRDKIYSTASAAGGALYLATLRHLYKITGE